MLIKKGEMKNSLSQIRFKKHPTGGTEKEKRFIHELLRTKLLLNTVNLK